MMSIRAGRRPLGTLPLVLTAAMFTLAQLGLVKTGMGLGWDETVYVSQVSSHAPPAFFSAPRARGISLLVAPVTSWSSSTSVLRAYLAVLSGLGLFLAFRAWRNMFPIKVLTLGAALFSTLWVTLFYGPQAMPNYWVAIGALAGAGYFARARSAVVDRSALWGVAAGGALMAWMRPTDAVWCSLPLFALMATVRTWRRPWPFAALAGGLLSGAAQWVGEAYLSYGGLGNRLSEASRIQGGLGWNIAVGDQLRSLGGRTLCRPCTGQIPGLEVTGWWLLLPLLAALGLVTAVRLGRAASTSLMLACAATASLPYLFMIGYAAPRFLLPAYALLAIPVADALIRLPGTVSRGWRPVVTVLLGIALSGHLVVQYVVLERTVQRTTAAHREWDRTADQLHHLSVRPPCMLTGYQALPVAFYAGCSSAATSGHNANSTPGEIVKATAWTHVAVIVAPGAKPPGYARSWEAHRIDDLRVYIPPTYRDQSRQP
ncbi:hypothetical protein OG613_45680 (plasmid) [Streptomyces sp. NBC_00015]|uniref:hypothetical protein n=1 Tax=Streptomyces sp. NBC_00015 TaxID=2903611 RepID=UPI002F90DBB4